MNINGLEDLRKLDSERAAKIERDFKEGKYGKDTANHLVRMALLDAR